MNKIINKGFQQLYQKGEIIHECEDYQEFVCKRVTNDSQYFARQYRNADMTAYTNIKLYNLIPITNIFIDEQIIVTLDLTKYSLAGNLRDMTQEQKEFAMAMLCITLQELDYRKVPIQISQNSIILFEQHICLQQFDINLAKKNEKTLFDQFKEIVTSKRLIPDFNYQDFESSTNYFLEKLNIYQGQTQHAPQIELINTLFPITQDLSSNQYIYVTQQQPILKIRFNEKSEIIIKSPDNTKVEQQLSLNDRELDIMEQLDSNEPFVSCFAYFRIQKQIFFFYKKYPQNLGEVLKAQEIYDRNIIEISHQLSNALNQLHRNHQIIHRNLTPQNIYLTKHDIELSKIMIAGFGKARYMDLFNSKTKLVQCQLYDAPELVKSRYDYKVDIWSVGMILFQLSNGGIYPIKTQEQYLKEEQYKSLTLEYIRNTLQDKKISEEFIQIIAACLSFDPQFRPTSQQLYESLKSEDYICQMDESFLSSHNLNKEDTFNSIIAQYEPIFMKNYQF